MIKQTHLTKKNILILAALILIVIDLLIYMLALNDYFIFSSELSINLVIFTAHFIYIYVSLIVVSKTKASKVFWGASGPFFLVPVAVVGWFLFFNENNPEYYYLS
ncbi:hypothetical protein, partial [Priestia megaterium]